MGGAGRLSSDYFFQLMLKLDFFLTHHMKPDFFFYKELKVRFKKKKQSCLVDSSFCPSVHPIDFFFFGNIESKKKIFQHTGCDQIILFSQKQRQIIFSKSLPHPR